MINIEDVSPADMTGATDLEAEERCRAVTRAGTQCSRIAQDDGFCYQHDLSSRTVGNESTDASESFSDQVNRSLDSLQTDLKRNINDIQSGVEDLIQDLREGNTDPQSAVFRAIPKTADDWTVPYSMPTAPSSSRSKQSASITIPARLSPPITTNSPRAIPTKRSGSSPAATMPTPCCRHSTTHSMVTRVSGSRTVRRHPHSAGESTNPASPTSTRSPCSDANSKRRLQRPRSRLSVVARGRPPRICTVSRYSPVARDVLFRDGSSLSVVLSVVSCLVLSCPSRDEHRSRRHQSPERAVSHGCRRWVWVFSSKRCRRGSSCRCRSVSAIRMERHGAYRYEEEARE